MHILTGTKSWGQSSLPFRWRSRRRRHACATCRLGRSTSAAAGTLGRRRAICSWTFDWKERGLFINLNSASSMISHRCTIYNWKNTVSITTKTVTQTANKSVWKAVKNNWYTDINFTNVNIVDNIYMPTMNALVNTTS